MVSLPCRSSGYTKTPHHYETLIENCKTLALAMTRGRKSFAEELSQETILALIQSRLCEEYDPSLSEYGVIYPIMRHKYIDMTKKIKTLRRVESGVEDSYKTRGPDKKTKALEREIKFTDLTHRTGSGGDVGEHFPDSRNNSPSSIAYCDEVKDHVLNGKDTLTQKEKDAIFVHRFLQGGKSVEDSAAILGISAGAFKSREFHARRTLREALHES